MSSPDAPGDRQPARHFTVHVEAVPSDVTGLPLMGNSGGKTALDRVAPAVCDEL